MSKASKPTIGSVAEAIAAKYTICVTDALIKRFGKMYPAAMWKGVPYGEEIRNLHAGNCEAFVQSTLFHRRLHSNYYHTLDCQQERTTWLPQINHDEVTKDRRSTCARIVTIFWAVLPQVEVQTGTCGRWNQCVNVAEFTRQRTPTHANARQRTPTHAKTRECCTRNRRQSKWYRTLRT
jgi:hypothetical protein